MAAGRTRVLSLKAWVSALRNRNTTTHLAIPVMVAVLVGCSNGYEEAEAQTTLQDEVAVGTADPVTSAYSSSSSLHPDGASVEEEGISETSDDQRSYATPSYMGYPCTVDCSGHEAGYQWAEENGIEDPSECGGNSNSFIEGCEAYAEEQSAEAEQDAEL